MASSALLATGCPSSPPRNATEEKEAAQPTPAAKLQTPTKRTPTHPPLARDEKILYGLGLSTDPYGESHPRGIGVVSVVANGDIALADVRRRGLRPEMWINRKSISTILARKGERRLLVFAFDKDGLQQQPAPALPPRVWDFAWSPDRKMIALEPIEQTRTGYTASLRIVVLSADGSGRREVARGSLAGWTPDGRLLYVTDAQKRFDRGGELMALDLNTGSAVSLTSGNEVANFAERPGPIALGNPVFSADEQFFALQASVVWDKQANRSTLFVARADGSPVRFITSRLAISMFAWSPRGHRLAYTTSGFPDPHQLFLVARPRAEPKRLLSKADHFDWVTWSPDARLLLVDDESEERWLLIDSEGKRPYRSVTRLGGAPLWCCPANTFSGGW